MRGRAVLVQGAVAAAALAVAAVVWLRPPPAGLPGEVPVAPLKHGEVKAVHWDDGSHRVDVFRGADAERTVWVRIATSPSILPPDGGVAVDGGTTGDGGTARTPLRPDAGPPGMPLRPDGGVHARADGGTDLLKALREAPPPPERELKGNDTAVQIFDRLSPPMATRDLGVATPGRRTELGIEGSSKRLALDTADLAPVERERHQRLDGPVARPLAGRTRDPTGRHVSGCGRSASCRCRPASTPGRPRGPPSRARDRCRFASRRRTGSRPGGRSAC